MLELHDLSVIYCYGIIDQLLYYSTKISRFTKAILILIKANEHYIKHIKISNIKIYQKGVNPNEGYILITWNVLKSKLVTNVRL